MGTNGLESPQTKEAGASVVTSPQSVVTQPYIVIPGTTLTVRTGRTVVGTAGRIVMVKWQT